MREAARCTTYKVVLLVAAMTVAAAVPRGSQAEEGLLHSETLDDFVNGKLGRRRRRMGRRELYHVDVTETGEPCIRHPSWSRVVDPDNYEFGCREIQVTVFLCAKPHSIYSWGK